MVEDVEDLRLELDLKALRDCEAFQSGDVNVVDGRQLQGVSAHVGQSPITGLDVFGVSVNGLVAHEVVDNVVVNATGGPGSATHGIATVGHGTAACIAYRADGIAL